MRDFDLVLDYLAELAYACKYKLSKQGASYINTLFMDEGIPNRVNNVCRIVDYLERLGR